MRVKLRENPSQSIRNRTQGLNIKNKEFFGSLTVEIVQMNSTAIAKYPRRNGRQFQRNVAANLRFWLKECQQRERLHNLWYIIFQNFV